MKNLEYIHKIMLNIYIHYLNILKLLSHLRNYLRNLLVSLFAVNNLDSKLISLKENYKKKNQIKILCKIIYYNNKNNKKCKNKKENTKQKKMFWNCKNKM